MTDYKEEILGRASRDIESYCTSGMGEGELISVAMDAAEEAAREAEGLYPDYGLAVAGYGVTGSIISGDFGIRDDPMKVASSYLSQIGSDDGIETEALNRLDRGEKVSDVYSFVVSEGDSDHREDFLKAACSDFDLYVSYRISDKDVYDSKFGLPESNLRGRDPEALSGIIRTDGGVFVESAAIKTIRQAGLVNGVDLKVRYYKVVRDNPQEHRGVEIP